MIKVIAHIDLDAFFVRAEELKNPKLENKPVAIGKDGRGGIVSTCSYKAREFGVKSGMPMFKAKLLCPDLIIVPVDFNYYEVLSNEFYYFLKQYTSKIQVASIDECYVDFTDLFKNNKNLNEEFFRQIQESLYKKIGLKCSIGVSTTTFLAKMGSDLKKPMGITIIRKKDIQKLLFSRPINTYYGIGIKMSEKLRSLNISTIGDLYYAIKNNNQKVISHLIKNEAENIVNCLEGNSSDDIFENNHFSNHSSIGNRRTLPYDTNDYNTILQELIKSFDDCYNRFNDKNLLCGGLTIVFRFTNFKTRTYSKKLNTPSDDYNYLKKILLSDFDNIFDNQTVRQVGITFERLIKNYNVQIQMSLFDYEYYEEKDPIYLMLKEFNKHIKNENSKLIRASDLLEEQDYGRK